MALTLAHAVAAEALGAAQRARILNRYLLAAVVTTVHLIARAVASCYTRASIGSRAD